MQSEAGSTYDTAEDVTSQGVLVPQPKVGQDSCFVLGYCVAGGCSVNTHGPNYGEKLTSGGAGQRLTRQDASSLSRTFPRVQQTPSRGALLPNSSSTTTLPVAQM